MPAWRAFIELSAGRTSHGFGPNPIVWADIKAWSELVGEGLHPWEVHLVKTFDAEWMKSIQPAPKPEPKIGGKGNAGR